MQDIIARIKSHQEIVTNLLEVNVSYIYTAKIILQEARKKGKKLYLVANGVNAMLSNSVAFSFNAYGKDNFACSLCNDITSMSYWANELGVEYVFEKQLRDKVKEGDIVFAISSSGMSKNILRALSMGRHSGAKTIGLSGGDGAIMGEFCDLTIVVNAKEESYLQEIFLMIVNMLAESAHDIGDAC